MSYLASEVTFCLSTPTEKKNNPSLFFASPNRKTENFYQGNRRGFGDELFALRRGVHGHTHHQTTPSARASIWRQMVVS